MSVALLITWLLFFLSRYAQWRRRRFEDARFEFAAECYLEGWIDHLECPSRLIDASDYAGNWETSTSYSLALPRTEKS